MPSSFMSPLRYPGGKARLYNFISSMIIANACDGGTYYEPFAGGAACGLRLLYEGVVKKVILNDADPCVYSFWYSILNETESFLKKIHEIPLTIESWKKQKEIWSNYTDNSRLDVGFATFFLNRCNRSGIIAKAGPIGGHHQDGKWKIDARFNRKTLIGRISIIAQMKSNIVVSNLDIFKFIAKNVKDIQRDNSFTFFDPPYFSAGQRLYFNTFKASDHLKFAKMLEKMKFAKWLLTYDKHDFIKDIYSWNTPRKIPISYSLQIKRISEEYVFSSQIIKFP